MRERIEIELSSKQLFNIVTSGAIVKDTDVSPAPTTP